MRSPTMLQVERTSFENLLHQRGIRRVGDERHQQLVGALADGAAVVLGHWRGSSPSVTAAMSLARKFADGEPVHDDTVQKLRSRLTRMGQRAEAGKRREDEWALRSALAVLWCISDTPGILCAFYRLRTAYQVMTSTPVDPTLGVLDRIRLTVEHETKSEQKFNDLFGTILKSRIRG